MTSVTYYATTDRDTAYSTDDGGDTYARPSSNAFLLAPATSSSSSGASDHLDDDQDGAGGCCCTALDDGGIEEVGADDSEIYGNCMVSGGRSSNSINNFLAAHQCCSSLLRGQNASVHARRNRKQQRCCAASDDDNAKTATTTVTPAHHRLSHVDLLRQPDLDLCTNRAASTYVTTLPTRKSASMAMRDSGDDIMMSTTCTERSPLRSNGNFSGYHFTNILPTTPAPLRNISQQQQQAKFVCIPANAVSAAAAKAMTSSRCESTMCLGDGSSASTAMTRGGANSGCSNSSKGRYRGLAGLAKGGLGSMERAAVAAGRRYVLAVALTSVLCTVCMSTVVQYAIARHLASASADRHCTASVTAVDVVATSRESDGGAEVLVAKELKDTPSSNESISSLSAGGGEGGGSPQCASDHRHPLTDEYCSASRQLLQRIKVMQRQLDSLQSQDRLPTDCEDVYQQGRRQSDVYTIHPAGCATSFRVYCHLNSTDTLPGIGTVIQRRYDGSVDFERNWLQYRQGFGSVQGEHWLGNERLHCLTSAQSYKLRIGFQFASSISNSISSSASSAATAGDRSAQQQTSARWYTVDYSHFLVEAESDLYRLRLGRCEGGSPELARVAPELEARLRDPGSDAAHDGMAFSAPDRDNDRYVGNCAEKLKAGFWYNSCYSINANGRVGCERVDCLCAYNDGCQPLARVVLMLQRRHR